MSQPVRTDPAPRPAAAAAPPRAATTLLVLLIAAEAGRLAFTLWEGPFDGTVAYSTAADPAYWPMHLYLGGPAYTASFVAAAVFLVLLGRSSVLGTAAGLMVGLGGVVFGLVITAEALPFAAADAATMPEAEGRALVDALNGRIEVLLPAILGSTAVIALGAVLGLVATLLARTAPRWFPPVALCGVVLSQVLPAAGLVAVGYLLELLVLTGIGWFGRRASSAATSVFTGSPSRPRGA